MKLGDDTFILYAAKYYDNPHCTSETEFHDDLRRIQYIKKLLSRYKEQGTLKERLILNHLITFFNCFGLDGTNMLYMRTEGLHETITPFIEYLNYLPKIVEYNGKILKTETIKRDSYIRKVLEEI